MAKILSFPTISNRSYYQSKRVPGSWPRVAISFLPSLQQKFAAQFNHQIQTLNYQCFLNILVIHIGIFSQLLRGKLGFVFCCFVCCFVVVQCGVSCHVCLPSHLPQLHKLLPRNYHIDTPDNVDLGVWRVGGCMIWCKAHFWEKRICFLSPLF